MKNFIIGLITLTSIAHGAEKTYFDKLGDLYKNGVRPDISKMLNTPYKGRCFFADSPNHPTGGAYIVREKDFRTQDERDDRDIGPIHQHSELEYEALSQVEGSDDTPTIFDNKSSDYIQNYNNVFNRFFPIAMKNNLFSMVIDYEYNKDFSDIEFITFSNLKASGDYLIEEIVKEKGHNATCLRRCYYFVPKYNNQSSQLDVEN